MSYESWASIGAALGWLGRALSPLLLLPLAAALIGVGGGFGGALRQMLARLVAAADAVNDSLGWLARWLAVLLVAVVAIVVVQRYVFGISITKLQESAVYLHAGLFMLAAGSTFLADGHVRVDLFYNRMGPRMKALTDLAGVYLFLLPMCWLMLTSSQGYVARAWRVWEASPETDGLPLVFALKTLIPVAAVLLVLAGFSVAGRAALILRGAPMEPHERHQEMTA